MRLNRTVRCLLCLTMFVAGCGTNPNWPAGVTFNCSCAPSSERVQGIESLLIDVGFISDVTTKNNSPEVETWLAPAYRFGNRRDLTALIYAYVGRGASFHVTITNTSVGGRLPPGDQEIVDRVQEGLDRIMPGEFLIGISSSLKK